MRECRYERGVFDDDDFEFTVLGYVHLNKAPPHLSSGELVASSDLPTPLSIRLEATFHSERDE